MWYAKNSASSGQGIVIDEQTGRTVAVAYNAKDTALLAAAPELLSALELMLSHAPYWIANNKNGEKQIDRDAIVSARAAIAKATQP